MGTLDIDAYKDFVLKLKIKKADGSPQEIRRVCLPRIVDRNGLVSFQQLVDLVITFHFPSCGGSSPEDFVYSLTYFDVDEDVITIASNDELADAMEQFVDKKVLRITTEVKRKASSSSSLKPSPNDTKEAPSQPQIQNVLDSFVGVLASTVNSIENGLVAPSSSSKGVEASFTQPTTVQPCKPAAAGSLKSPTTTTEPLSLRPHKEAQKETTEEACPFIHGRHTCDSCLKTPIIGKRFHATNIKDYDLCQGCYENYKGTEGDQCETLLSMKKKSESIANVETGEEKEEEAPGALILNSEDQDSKTLDVEGWHVVEEVAEPDKEIGLCTQMLGSTLFNSDMRSSQEQENVSALTGSDSFSAATSVPSTVSSIHLGTDVSYVAPEQRNRWASQLEKLHELGFDDETLCVETLERLHAANIGCNEQDEVSVTQVVNAILEK